MPGGLMNLISEGNQNIILTGNPTKSFFKCTYAKYTNFGLQKFRIDYDGQRTLNLNADSNFKFKMPRTGGDLIMDTYLVVTLPTIWSPIIPPDSDINYDEDNATINILNKWRPYEFKWIKHIGSQMIRSVRFTVGGQVIQEFTGSYLHAMVERDFDANKKDLYYKMTGHVPELNDPANAYNRVNVYPNAYVMDEAKGGAEPSIRSRNLYIPLNIWFTMASKMAFPISALQYNEFHIEVDIRPVKELYVIRNIPDKEDPGSYYHQSNFNEPREQFYRFMHPPPSPQLLESDFDNTRTIWNADVHLISTYAFLSEDEKRVFQLNEQTYLIKQIYTHHHKGIVGSAIIDIETRGMVSSWMWYLQRSDILLRNEWSNYFNWPYEYLPYNAILPKNVASLQDVNIKIVEVNNTFAHPEEPNFLITPQHQLRQPNKKASGEYSKTTVLPSSIALSGVYKQENLKNIMESWGLIIDGKYRENTMDAGIFNYVEKYTRTAGNGPDGLYCYNFCLNNSATDFQPSGAINMSKFNKIQFELGLIHPPLDTNATVDVVCNSDGNLVGIDKTHDNIFEYTYDLTVFEERYNILTFSSGNAALSYAR
tara:strand:+ start:941 stop:2722 length:1782 start_codon:yes stop_codon:yes gene_type:complete